MQLRCQTVPGSWVKNTITWTFTYILSEIPHALSRPVNESVEFPVNGVVHHFPGYRSFGERISTGRPETPFSNGFRKARSGGQKSVAGGRQKVTSRFEIADSSFNGRHFPFLSPSGFRAAQRGPPSPGVHQFSM